MKPKSRVVDPELARARGLVGALTRCVKNGERSADELLVAQHQLEQAKNSIVIDKLVAAAPVLTSEQRTKLAELLRPIRVTAGLDGGA